MRKIVIFASGAGSNCKTIYNKLVKSEKIAILVKIITDNSNAGVLHWAKENGIQAEIINPKQISSTFEFGNVLISKVDKDIDLIILAGYLKLIPENFIKAFPGKILNIHPALLPLYGGKGMYGINVHKAVFKNGDAESGLTIHLVDEKYDHGPVVFQSVTSIEDCSSPVEIAEKVLALEHESYWQVVKKMLTKKYEIVDGEFYWKDDE